MPQVNILCHQVKLPLAGMSYISLSHWPKGLHGIPHPAKCHRLSVVTKAISCSVQPDGKAQLLKTAFTYVMKHGEVKLVPH